MEILIIILQILNSWVFYPLIIYFALSYAKQSAKEELNKVDNLVYWACIIALLMGGIN